MIEIPSKNQWVQTNRSDVFGNLQGSFNLDLTKVFGKTRVTRMLQTTGQTTGAAPDSDMTSFPVGFKVFNSKIWTVAGLRVHQTGAATANATFVVDTTTNSPTTCSSNHSDIAVFNASLYVTTSDASGDKLYKVGSGNWDTGNSTGLGNVTGPHMLEPFLKNQRLYIGIAGLSKIYSMDASDTITTSSNYTLTLDANYRITFIRASSNRLWIGTIGITGKGYVFEWDGYSTAATNGYRLEAAGALACAIKDDVPWIMDTNGRLCAYSNGTFVEKARLPLNDKFLLKATNTINDRFIHPNGMAVINGRINILINNILDDATGSIAEFCPSGIWEYDDNIGLYHKSSLSYFPAGQDASVLKDFGQNRISGVGALADMKLTNSAANATGNLIAGAVVYTSATATDAGTFTNDTFDAVSGTSGQYAIQGSGYFVTSKFFASGSKGEPSAQNMWQNAYTLYRKLLSASDKIIVKYRTSDAPPIEATITWTSTSTFTTTTNVLGLEGYEVEITQGTGAGKTAHITRIEVTAGVYTVILDDTFPGVTTGTAKARFQAWKNISTITSTSLTTYDVASINEQRNWVQLKVCMLFTGPEELEKLLLISANTNPAN